MLGALQKSALLPVETREIDLSPDSKIEVDVYLNGWSVSRLYLDGDLYATAIRKGLEDLGTGRTYTLEIMYARRNERCFFSSFPSDPRCTTFRTTFSLYDGIVNDSLAKMPLVIAYYPDILGYFFCEATSVVKCGYDDDIKVLYGALSAVIGHETWIFRCSEWPGGIFASRNPAANPEICTMVDKDNIPFLVPFDQENSGKLTF